MFFFLSLVLFYDMVNIWFSIIMFNDYLILAFTVSVIVNCFTFQSFIDEFIVIIIMLYKRYRSCILLIHKNKNKYKTNNNRLCFKIYSI